MVRTAPGGHGWGGGGERTWVPAQAAVAAAAPMHNLASSAPRPFFSGDERWGLGYGFTGDSPLLIVTGVTGSGVDAREGAAPSPTSGG
ncbi:MAG TPA: hypothetical protein VLQ93_21360, partial [Myxococcaceae bacterium]|nr:hypothetical protein [Myxococcaceae bacterium]